MLTGDQRATAPAIATAVGLAKGFARIIEGDRALPERRGRPSAAARARSRGRATGSTGHDRSGVSPGSASRSIRWRKERARPLLEARASLLPVALIERGY